jgi:hypothetical protein
MSASIKSVASLGFPERFMVYANHADGNGWCVCAGEPSDTVRATSVAGHPAISYARIY